MNITESKIYLRNDGDKKLKAYATITFDNSFVVRDLKVIDGSKGLFIAMPSRKMKDACPKCRHRNEVGSKHCNQCGMSLPEKAPSSKEERMQDHRDIAHPITAQAREYIQEEVLKAYDVEKNKGREVNREQKPAYEPQPEPRPEPKPEPLVPDNTRAPLVADPSDPLEARLQSTDL